jgi:hypothetical protein
MTSLLEFDIPYQPSGQLLEAAIVAREGRLHRENLTVNERVFAARFLHAARNCTPLPPEIESRLTGKTIDRKMKKRLSYFIGWDTRGSQTDFDTFLALNKSLLEGRQLNRTGLQEYKKMLASLDQAYNELLPTGNLDLLDHGYNPETKTVRSDHKPLDMASLDMVMSYATKSGKRIAEPVIQREYTISELMKGDPPMISPQDLKKWQEVTGLSDFRMRIFISEKHFTKSDYQVSQAVLNAKQIFKLYPGYPETLEGFEKLPAMLARLQEEGVVVLFDPPGQGQSTFGHEQNLATDSYLISAQGYQLAIDASLKMFGFDLPEIREKFTTSIGRQRGANAILNQGLREWQNPQRKAILISPISHSSHPGRLDGRTGLRRNIKKIFGETDELTASLFNYFIEKGNDQISDLIFRQMCRETIPPLTAINRRNFVLFLPEDDTDPLVAKEKTAKEIRKKAGKDFRYFKIPGALGFLSRQSKGTFETLLSTCRPEYRKVNRVVL